MIVLPWMSTWCGGTLPEAVNIIIWTPVGDWCPRLAQPCAMHIACMINLHAWSLYLRSCLLLLIESSIIAKHLCAVCACTLLLYACGLGTCKVEINTLQNWSSVYIYCFQLPLPVSGPRFQLVCGFKLSVVSRSCLDFSYIGFVFQIIVKNRNHCNIRDGELEVVGEGIIMLK